MKYLKRELEKVNWKRVWLIVLIVYVIAYFGVCTMNGVINS